MMRRLIVAISLIALSFAGIGIGLAGDRVVGPSAAVPFLPKCLCPPHGHIPMETCCPVVYDEQKATFYKTQYKEVTEKVAVIKVKYVAKSDYRCVPTRVQEPCQDAGWLQGCETQSGPVRDCPTPMVETCVLRKVAVPVIEQVSKKEVVERRRLVAVQVPYTVTICVPRGACTEMPGEASCPGSTCCPKCGHAR